MTSPAAPPPALPDAADGFGRHARLASFTAKRLAELPRILQHPVCAPFAAGVEVFLRPAADVLIGRRLAPDLRPSQKETLFGRKAVDRGLRAFAPQHFH